MEQEEAIADLREALDSYAAYAHFVDQGSFHVNADDDPEMLVEAAAMDVQRAIGRCRAVGLDQARLIEAVESHGEWRPAQSE